MIDDFRHIGLRKQLVQVRAKGIKDEKVLWAIAEIPRHYLLIKFFKYAYRIRHFLLVVSKQFRSPTQ